MQELWQQWANHQPDIEEDMEEEDVKKNVEDLEKNIFFFPNQALTYSDISSNNKFHLVLTVNNGNSS